MADDLLINLIKRIQNYVHRIEPVLDIVDQARLLLDRLEQVERVESRMGQVRLIVDAVDDFLKEIPRIRGERRSSESNLSQLARMAESLSPEEIERLMEILSRKKRNSRE
ncbi:hypothetical protein J7M22_08400 [Candidatus Poribacteria bacterium]|nr:hypothetical protein [Candidatus Poribacteria bacterium]